MKVHESGAAAGLPAFPIVVGSVRWRWRCVSPQVSRFPGEMRRRKFLNFAKMHRAELLQAFVAFSRNFAKFREFWPAALRPAFMRSMTPSVAVIPRRRGS